MKKPLLIAPSAMSMDFRNLEQQFALLNRSAADMLHIDVTDGLYVPTISLGYHAIGTMAALSTLPLDFHLMMIRPEEHLVTCKRLGACTISVQLDVLQDVARTIQAIKRVGCRVGLALHPHTRPEAAQEFLPVIDVLLLLAVSPGFGGQKFLSFVLEKIKTARRLINEHGTATQICVDGGVTAALAPSLVAAGADILVAGHAVFGAGDIQQNILRLKSQHEGA